MNKLRNAYHVAILAFGALTALVLFPIFASAHGTVFYEANPDNASRFNTATVETPVQLISPPGDFWNGTDLWFDNEGPSGSLAVELRKNNGILVASAEAIVPRRTRVWGGSRLHIDFPSQFAIVAGEQYSLTLRSSLTGLYLYYFERSQLLEHSSPFMPQGSEDRFLGRLRFGAADQEFKLKLALTELTESAPPEVNNVVVRLSSPQEAAIEFNASELVDFRVDLTPQTGAPARTEFRGSLDFCPQGNPPCVLSVSVFPDTDYSFELMVRDQWENSTIARGSFRSLPAPPSSSPSSSSAPSPNGDPGAPAGTPAPTIAQTPQPDRTPPVILNARAVLVSSERIQIAWQTNEAADSRLTLFRESVPAGAENDATFELEHTLSLSETFTAGASYEAVLASRDPTGNETTVRLPLRIPERAVQTSNSPSPTPSGNAPPVASPAAVAPSSYTAAVHSAPNGPMLEVRWDLPVSEASPHGYRVDVFDSSLRLIRSEAVPKDAHGVSVPVEQNESYQVIVYENTNGTLEKIGPPAAVNVPAEKTVQKPVSRTVFTFSFLLILAVPAAVIIKKLMASK